MKKLSKWISVHLHFQDFKLRIVKKKIKTEKGKGRKGKREGGEEGETKLFWAFVLYHILGLMLYVIISFNSLIQQYLFYEPHFKDEVTEALMCPKWPSTWNSQDLNPGCQTLMPGFSAWPCGIPPAAPEAGSFRYLCWTHNQPRCQAEDLHMQSDHRETLRDHLSLFIHSGNEESEPWRERLPTSTQQADCSSGIHARGLRGTEMGSKHIHVSFWDPRRAAVLVCLDCHNKTPSWAV